MLEQIAYSSRAKKMRYEVDPNTGCWVWSMMRDRGGYSKLFWRGKTWLGHRLFYEVLVGPTPKGYVLDHKCRNRACVNIHHLEPVKPKVNVRRGSKAKLSVEDVRMIRRCHKRGVKTGKNTTSALARKYGVNPSAILKIVTRQTWK